MWEALTRPEHVRRWYGPRRMTVTVCEIDLRVGGAYRFVLRDAEGNESGFSGVYREIVHPERLVQTWAWDGMPDHGTLETATLEEHEGGTRLTTHALFQAREDLAGWTASGGPAGMNETLDRLVELVAGLSSAGEGDEKDREIVVERVFDAPRETVFDAFIRPEQVAQWWGPRGFTLTTHEMDVRPGGLWLFTMHGPDGTDYANRVLYTQVERPSRLAYDQGGAGETADIHFRVTGDFTDEGGGRTRLRWRLVFDTLAARRLAVEKYGAVEGGKQTMERLAEFLAG